MNAVEALLLAAQAAGPEAAALAGERLRAEIETAERAWKLRIEKAKYESQRAERQYMAVEPENRTVARELERRWNERLLELETPHDEAARASRGWQPLTEAELARAQDLGRNLERVWHASTTMIRGQKRLLGTLIDEVQVNSEHKRNLVRIVWKGGTVMDREVIRFRQRDGQARPHRTAEEIVELVRKLACEFDDTQIARILHRQGHRSGLGLALTQSSVSSLRHKNDIPAWPRKQPREGRDGPFTADEAARELGVSMHTVHLWQREGMLAGEQAAAYVPWQILITAVCASPPGGRRSSRGLGRPGRSCPPPRHRIIIGCPLGQAGKAQGGPHNRGQSSVLEN